MKFKLGNALLLLLLVASGAVARDSVADTLDRAGRIMQEASFKIGSKTYTRSPAVTKYCTDKDVKTSDLNPSNDEFNKEMEKTTNKYAGPRPQLEPLLKSGGSNTNVDVGAAVSSVAVQIGFPVVISVFSLLSAWFLFWWSLLECCCKKTCCMKEIKEGDPLTCGQKCIGIFNVVVGLGLLIILIIWAAQAGGAAGGFKYLTCEMASLSSDIVSGVEYKGETPLKFIGLDGLSNMLKEMNNAINAFSSKPINKPAGMDQRKTDLQTKLDNFNTKWSNSANQNAIALTIGDAATRPDSIKAFDSVINQPLRKEITELTTYGTQMASAYDTVKQIKDQTATMTSAISSMTKTIDDVRSPVKTVGEQGIESLRIEVFQSLINTALGVSLGIIIAFLAIFYFIAFMNIFKNKLHCLKFLNKLIMIIKILISVFLNLAAALFVVVSIVFSNMCYFLWKASTDPEYSTAFSDQTIKNIMKECVLTTAGGTGDMTKLMGGGASATDQIKKFTDISSTINAAFNDTVPDYFKTNTVNPPVGWDTLKIKIFQGAYDGKYDDFVGVSGAYQGYQKDFDAFNQKMSSVGNANRMFLQGACPAATYPTASDISKTADPLLYKMANADAFCLQLGALPANNANANSGNAGAPNDASNRYNNQAGNAADIQTLYNKPIKTWTDYKARVAISVSGSSFSEDYGFGTFSATANTLSDIEKQYLGNIVTAYNDFKGVRTDIAGLSDYINAFSGNLLGALNCRIIGIHVKQLQVAMCLKVGDAFINQTTSLAALGFFIFLFPWCICCGIRCAPKKGATDKNQTAPEPNSQALPPQQEMAPVGFQPQAQPNPYGAPQYPGPQGFAQPAKGYL